MTRKLTYLFICLFLATTAAYSQALPIPKINPLAPSDWKRMENLDSHTYGATAFSLNDEVYLATGDTGRFSFVPRQTTRFMKLDTIHSKWFQQTRFTNGPAFNPAAGRVGAVSFVLNVGGRQVAFVGGGRRIIREQNWGTMFIDLVFNDLWSYDTTNKYWSQQVSMPRKLAHSVAFVLKKNLGGIPHERAFVVGGYRMDYPEYDTLIIKRDYYTGVDSATAVKLPLPYGTLLTTGNKGIHAEMIGNVSPKDSIFRSCYEYLDYTRVGGGRWVERADMPAAAGGRYGAVAFVVADSVAMIGLGNATYTGSGLDPVHFRDFWSYSPTGHYSTGGKTGVYQRRADFQFTGRSYAAAWGAANIGIVCTGYDGKSKRDVYEYNHKSNSWDRFNDFPDSVRMMAAYTVNELIAGYLIAGKDVDTVWKSVWRYRMDTTKIDMLKLTDTVACNTDSFMLKYKANNAAFFPSNRFIVEISDSTGDFGNFKILDTVPKTTILDSFYFKFNKHITVENGSGYKIRVRSTSPRVLGTPTEQVIRIEESPSIKGQPSSFTGCVGNNASFYVTLNYYAKNPRFRWFKDGVPIDSNQKTKYKYLHSDAAPADHPNGDSLVILNVTTTDAGNYYCVVTGGCAPADTSNIAVLAVDSLQDPLVTQQPVDIELCGGDSYVMTTAATGKSLNYRWVKIDSTITVLDTTVSIDTLTNGANIEDAFTDSLSFRSVSESDTGWYFAYIFEDCGNDTFTQKVKLRIRGMAEVIDQPQKVIDTFETMNIFFTLNAKGTGLKYQWYKDNIPLSDGAKYSGTKTNTLYITYLQINDAGLYNCIITDTCGNKAVSNYSTLDVQPYPVLTLQPEPYVSVCEGEKVILKVAADGANLVYQWQRKVGGVWTDLPGDTSRVFSSITSAQFSDSGNYRCVVTSSLNGKSAFSEVSIVFVKPIPGMCTLLQFSNTISSTCPGIGTCGTIKYLWYRDGVFIPGAVSSSFLIVQSPEREVPAQYTLRIICDDCYSPVTFPPMLFTPPASVGKIITGNLVAYPNPVNGSSSLTVEIPETVVGVKTTLRVYDVLGKLITERDVIATGKMEIPTTGWAHGVYQVVLKNENAQFATKIVKQ